jgi:8-oxo-dGTP diphosphatase
MPAASTIQVVAGVIRQNNAFLICQRRRDGAFPLKWEFPGGKVEPGETLQESLARELQEELAINACIGPLLHRACHHYLNALSVELFFYQVTSYEGQPCNHAFEQMCWVTPDRLSAYDFLDGDAEFISRLCRGDVPLS